MKPIRVTDPAMPNAHVIISFNEEFNEFTARLFIGGKAQKAADYFTDDKHDAMLTAHAMLHQQSSVIL